MSEVKGYVVMWKTAAIRAPFADVAKLAQDVNFAQGPQEAKKFIPQPRNKRNAWETATNLGKSGLRVDAPEELVKRVKAQYNGVEPIVRLKTVIISKSAPILTRHIVREVVIPVQDKSAGYKTLAEKQLDLQTVSVMEFDCATDTMISSSYHELHDEDGWVNGNLKQVVSDLHHKVDQALNYCDRDQVADSIRTWLFAHNATLLSSYGGAYVLPAADGMVDKLVGLKAFIEGLNEYRPDQKGERLQVTVFPWVKSPESDIFGTDLDIAQNVIDQLKNELQAVVDDLSPVLAGERSEKVAENVRTRATVKFLETSARIQSYKDALGDELDQLNAFLQMTQSAMLAAQQAPVKPGKAEMVEEND